MNINRQAKARNNYPDDPRGVRAHQNRYKGGTALIVLGGYSGARWAELYALIKPDVLLGANGVNSIVYGMDYWMCAENMNYTNNQAASGDKRAIDFMVMFHRHAGAKIKLVSHHSWNLLRDTHDCISIRRETYDLVQSPDTFSVRDYGTGFLAGWVYRNTNAMRLAQRVGTVGSHLLHMAGILGCAEVHTIGFDLLFRDEAHHHWYEYPVYRPDHFRNKDNFITYKGVKTQEIWLEAANFLKTAEPIFKRDGLKWIDHSDGLLKIEGLDCSNQ